MDYRSSCTANRSRHAVRNGTNAADATVNKRNQAKMATAKRIPESVVTAIAAKLAAARTAEREAKAREKQESKVPYGTDGIFVTCYHSMAGGLRGCTPYSNIHPFAPDCDERCTCKTNSFSSHTTRDWVSGMHTAFERFRHAAAFYRAPSTFLDEPPQPLHMPLGKSWPSCPSQGTHLLLDGQWLYSNVSRDFCLGVAQALDLMLARGTPLRGCVLDGGVCLELERFVQEYLQESH